MRRRKAPTACFQALKPLRQLWDLPRDACSGNFRLLSVRRASRDLKWRIEPLMPCGPINSLGAWILRRRRVALLPLGSPAPDRQLAMPEN